jgi:catechol 2,3-dioxygenase-like lactoylglutathione lyase family enzyme
MFGRKHFYFGDNITVGVRNLDLAIQWYQEKLGLRRADVPGEEVDALLVLSKDADAGLGLVVCGPNVGPDNFERHLILYSNKIEAAHEDFVSRGISVGPIQADSGRNRFFQFQDLDGNTIEVCVEP